MEFVRVTAQNSVGCINAPQASFVIDDVCLELLRTVHKCTLQSLIQSRLEQTDSSCVNVAINFANNSGERL
jgi:hypothetical protein